MPEDLAGPITVAMTAAIVVIALAAVALVVGVLVLVRDLRRLSRAAERTLGLVETELPPTIRDLRSATANLERLTRELEPRLERVDALLDEAEATSLSLRATVEAAEDIVRGPAAAVDRTKRTVSAAGKGLARGADRIRRSVEQAAARREQR
jgi:uncharacterized protein YoxC